MTPPDPINPVEARERFFVDHGLIHDRVTGKHVTTAPDDEVWFGGTISDCVDLLNELSTQRDQYKSLLGEAAEILERYRRGAFIIRDAHTLSAKITNTLATREEEGS